MIADVDFRTGDPAADAVDGVVPQAVAIPQTAAAAAATLAWASAQRQTVVIRGAGTKMAWGRRPASIDLVVDMRGLNRLVAHQHGDLTVSVEAGIALGDVNRSLGAHGQWLPLDPASGEHATIGGLLATNDSGPLRHRHGTPRDLVIGVRLATTDGRLVKAGGQVVKNVAGYDLSRLVCGSFGSLAAIVGATFKVSPLPAASSTLLADSLEAELLVRIADLVTSSQLEPLAFECRARYAGAAEGPSLACLLRFASTPAALDAQIDAARACVRDDGVAFQVVTGEAERSLWTDHARPAGPGGAGAVLRVSWLPAGLGRLLALLQQIGEDGPIEMTGRLAVGAGTIWLDGEAGREAAVVSALRASDAVGNVVLVRSRAEVRAAVDPWGPQPNARLLESLKRSLDPNGILGAGRGPM